MAKNKIVYFGTTLIDLTDTTATASDVAAGKYFYTADGVKTVGTASGGGGGGDYPWFGTNTVKDYTKTITINLKNDTSWDSWTASTTATSILAAPTTNDFSYTFDYKQYSISIVKTMVTNYTLKSTATKQKIPFSFGRIYIMYYFGIPSTYNEYQNNIITASTNASYDRNVLYYYNSTGTKVAAASATYGVYSGTPTFSTSISGDNLTIGFKRAVINARCNNSYFSTARKGDIDSENTNIVITSSIYKTPNSGSVYSKELDGLRLLMNASPAN